MFESIFTDHSVPAPQVWPTSLPLPASVDSALLLSALQRWRKASDDLRELFTGVPSAETVLTELLERELDLGEPGSGLLFSATARQPEQFVGFTSILAFIYQDNRTDTTIGRPCTVVGLKNNHPMASLAPQSLLTRIRMLAAETELNRRWNSYWDARAPGTPVSRRLQAGRLYCAHLEATAHAAVAQRTLTADQSWPLWQLLGASAQESRLNDPAIHCEHLDLVPGNDGQGKVPGAWVISVGDRQSGSQLLYLPHRPVPVQAFSSRSVLESWLAAQELVAQGATASGLRFEYSDRALPLSTGMTDLLNHLQQARIHALRQGAAGKTGLAEHGPQALDQTARLDRQFATGAVAAAPPGVPESTRVTEDDERPLFGGLSADIPWPVRQAALTRQRNALDSWSTIAGAEERQTLERLFQDLQAAEHDGDAAAHALLYRERVLDTATFNREFTALHQAHAKGLMAEAGLQRTLKQMSEEQYRALKAVLDTTGGHHRDWCAAEVSLTMHEQDDALTCSNRQILNGPLVFLHETALSDPAAPHDLILYWPGTGGGLQCFDNRRELEREVFKIQDQDPVLKLQLTQLSGDPLQHALNRLSIEFDEQAGAIRRRYSDVSQSAQCAEHLETLRRQFVAGLQVPVSAARELAAAQQRELDRSTSLAARLPDWLNNLSASDGSRLRLLIEAYISAMHRSHRQMELALPPRDDFTRQHVLARLREDFSLQGTFEVQLELPDTVVLERHSTAAPGAPGTPQKLVAVPGKTRSRMSLETLAQHNIDNTPSMQLEPLSLRLGFMKVEVSASIETERRTLTHGITRDYLLRTLPGLDLPKAYESLIRRAFMGSNDVPPFVNAYHRECLLEPWRLMLRLQGECARLQNQITAQDLQIFGIAIDADTSLAWRAGHKHIVLLPVFLSTGGKDTPNEGPVTLSGVCFIEEQVSGATLLYLADGPDNRFLRRYDSLEAARRGLFELCAQDQWTRYVAGRALSGDLRAHEQRIGQAVLKRFDALIGVGERWPVTTSLAGHLLDADMGRLIEAHRGTSRSNDALYLERYALSGARAYNYIKMALGLVPFVGTAIGLYDAWTSANQAVAAFLRGAVGDGLADIEALLLALIDAAMDILPAGGAGTGAGAASRARTLTRSRQVRQLTTGATALKAPDTRRAGQITKRFAGYEYPQPVFLSGLQPASAGLFRNVYRHPDGDFVVRQGRVYQVELSKDSRGWRLSGNSQKTYKQPIALNEAGNWDTHFGVYGTLFDGGGAGGGNVLGHLADTLDPVWPLSIRQRLPRWWGDRVFRRQQQLTQACDDLAAQIDARFDESLTAINRYRESPVDQRPALRAAADAACIGDIEMASRRYHLLADLMPLTHGNKRRKLIECMSLDAWKVADRLQLRIGHTRHQVGPLLDRIDSLIERLDALPAERFAEQVALHREIRGLRLEMMQKTDRIEELMQALNHWYERIGLPRDKVHVRADVEALNQRLSEGKMLYLNVGNLLEIVQRFDHLGDVSLHFLHNQAQPLRARVDRALYTQFSLPEASVSRAQRNRILQDCLDTYAQFRRAMTAWTASYSQHFYMDDVPALLTGIEKMAGRARRTLELPNAPAVTGQSTKKIFTTEDNQLLIGVEHWESTTQTRRYHLTGKGGVEEIWEQGSNGKYHLSEANVRSPFSVERNLDALASEARARLDRLPAYEIKVETHARQDMLPVDLEHMMVSEADELIRRAQGIEQIDTQNPLIATLRGKATELRIRGRQMRTRQSLGSKNPTDGMLDDLIGQSAADIRKIAPLKHLGKRKDGRIDYLQEYEIRDLTQTPPKLLWYAHFHYSKATPGFREFEKAHLKLPKHRSLTHADDPSLPYADIGKRSAVLIHFENL